MKLANVCKALRTASDACEAPLAVMIISRKGRTLKLVFQNL